MCPVLPVKQLAWEIGNPSWVYRENCQKKIILTQRVLFLEKLFGGPPFESWDLTDWITSCRLFSLLITSVSIHFDESRSELGEISLHRMSAKVGARFKASVPALPIMLGKSLQEFITWSRLPEPMVVPMLSSMLPGMLSCRKSTARRAG